MSRIIFDRDELVGEFVRKEIGGIPTWGHGYRAIGLEHQGELIAGCVFNHYSITDICLSVAANRKGWLTRSFIFACFHYAFVQLNCRRVTALVKPSNRKSLKFVRDLGFQYEGCMRETFSDSDGLLFGMLRRECTWLGGLAHV